ncbi:pseudouridine synthase [Telmatobacter sp. DSM 110680]|uniref:Pseudouridine synthase n=1 Tax=Telmatobacter sp. DSM 110680 TaxID=3036704 RepID=A0AAU7DLW1_9BACT
MSDDVRPDENQPELDPASEAEEATAAAASDTFEQASDAESEPIADDADAAGVNTPEEDEQIDAIAEPELPGKLERLQKILAQAGVASRRHAENLITEGRVQVNGKVITELGTKADAARDHIRVDGKLLQGSERLRYFMLNKPRGFVTTVSDPEKRPTVMEFFAKLRERLYPVGRLDYLSEGLLLVTNDGDLANKLTKAASGVQKTYLVKVSGEPTEEELDRLRSGVAIERGKPGSGRVHTAPAQIRKVRQGDNPWYEVVIIEGRNRELRKMFEEIGHYVEKIRRVGYGPLVLDVEPGKMRELEPEELEDLRKAADGKLKPKLKDIRRKKAMDAQLPTVKPTLRRPQAFEPSTERPAFSPKREFPPKKQYGTDRPTRPARPSGEGFRPKPGFAEKGPGSFGSQRPGFQRAGSSRSGPPRSGPPKFGTDRPAWKKDDRTARPPARFGERPPRTERPAQFESRPARPDRPTGGFAGARRPEGGRPFEKKPWKKPDTDRPAFKPHPKPRREAVHESEDTRLSRPSKLHIEAVEPERESTFRPSTSRPPTGRPSAGRPPFRGVPADRPRGGRTGERVVGQSRPGQFRPRLDQPGQDRPRQDRQRPDRPMSDRPRLDRPKFDRPKFDRASGPRPSAGPGRTGAREFGEGRPPRAAGTRPFTTSSGKPRAGGARPSNKRAAAGAPGKPAWKPKTGGSGRPASGGRPSPAFGARPGGFSKSGPGFKGKSGGARKPAGGPRSGGPRPGGKPGGKKRG